MVTASVILPTYNEVGHIESLITAISQTLIKAQLSYEIIVVDDDSPDGTAAAVARVAQKISPVRL